MTRIDSVQGLLLLCVLTSPLAAQDLTALPFTPLSGKNGALTMGFEESVEGWLSLDPAAQPTHTKEEANRKEGAGALEFSYTIKQGAFTALMRGNLSVPGAKSLSFWIKTPQAGVFALGLFEKDGSNYLSLFGTPKDQWQQVRYDLDEFRLRSDSTDENGRLDVDQLYGLGLMDFDALLATRGAGAIGATRTVWLDEVAFSPVPVLPAPTEGVAQMASFDASNGRWGAMRIGGPLGIGFDPTGAVTLTTAEAEHKEGAAALKYQYSPDGAGAAALMGSVAFRLAEPKSIGFWIKTATPTLLGVLLTEYDDSSYLAVVPAAGGDWQHVDLNLTDFELGDDSQDENDKLDPAQVSGLALVDAALLLGVKITGEEPLRTVWLDGLTESEKSAPARARVRQTAKGRELFVDDFETRPPDWLALTVTGLATGKPQFRQEAATKLTLVEDKAPEADGQHSLRVQYLAPEGGVVALFRPLNRVSLAGAQGLSLRLKSQYDAKLLVQVEERDGSGYEQMLNVGGSDKWGTQALSFADFKLSNDKVDENGQLDLDQVGHLLLIDVSAMAGEPGPNQLWLDDLVVSFPTR